MNNSIKKPRKRNKAGMFTFLDLPVDSIVELYTSGQSEKQIAKRFNVSRNVIRKRLVSQGIEIRPQSERIKLVWQGFSKERRISQVKAAHNATRGKSVSFETKCKHAKTIEKYPSNFSESELILQKMLSERGIETIHQKAIGPYNCDLAAYPIAVEIFGGNWHFFGHHAARFNERTRYILNRGWYIYIIPISESFPLTAAVADYAASYIKSIRRQKPPICEYRMVWGAGKLTTTGSLKDDDFSIIPSFKDACKLTARKNKRIPK